VGGRSWQRKHKPLDDKAKGALDKLNEDAETPDQGGGQVGRVNLDQVLEQFGGNRAPSEFARQNFSKKKRERRKWSLTALAREERGSWCRSCEQHSGCQPRSVQHSSESHLRGRDQASQRAWEQGHYPATTERKRERGIIKKKKKEREKKKKKKKKIKARM